MDVFGLFTGKNDLAKFLTIGGLFMIVLSLMYPLEKSKELDLQIVETNQFVDELNQRSKSIKTTVSKKVKEKKSIESNPSIDSIKKLHLIDSIRNVLVPLNKELKQKKKDVAREKEKTNVLKKYMKKYLYYLNSLIIVGIISFCIGLLTWTIAAYRQYKNDKSSK